MSTLLYGRGPSVSLDEDVRSTTNVIDNDAPASVADSAPDFNETVTDLDTEGGLTSRQVASHIKDSAKSSPVVGNANEDLNGIVDRQISTSGTAAARESAGQWGHGSLLITEGIEPVIRPGTEFSDTYFAANANDIQSGTGNYISPANPADPGTLAAAQSQGTAAARESAPVDMYAAFHAARMGK